MKSRHWPARTAAASTGSPTSARGQEAQAGWPARRCLLLLRRGRGRPAPGHGLPVGYRVARPRCRRRWSGCRRISASAAPARTSGASPPVTPTTSCGAPRRGGSRRGGRDLLGRPVPHGLAAEPWRVLPDLPRSGGRPCVVVGGARRGRAEGGRPRRRRDRQRDQPVHHAASGGAGGRGAYPLLARDYRPGDLDGHQLAFVATDDGQVNGAVAEEGRARITVWVNAADDPTHCAFILPSVLRRGALQVAVATGDEPALSRDPEKSWRATSPPTTPRSPTWRPRSGATSGSARRPGPRPGIARWRSRRSGAWLAEDTPGEGARSALAHLAGAGLMRGIVSWSAWPGRPWSTRWGLELLRSADVVVYDRLVNPSLLDHAPPGARAYQRQARAATGGRRSGPPRCSSPRPAPGAASSG